MGLTDTVIVEDEVTLPEYPADAPRRFQTKSLQHPARETYKITADGCLLRQEEDTREKTEAEKQAEAREHGFDSWDTYVTAVENASFSECLDNGWPITPPQETTVEDTFWVDHNQHGTFEFHKKYDDFYYSYEARFTRGDLDDIVFLGDRLSNSWTGPQ